MTNQAIAIDGPAAAGKTTVARLLAERIGALLFDTGVLYRAITLLALEHGVAERDNSALTALATDHTIDVRPATVPDGRLYDVLINGRDVTWAIRTPAVDAAVSAVSAHAAVRAALLPVQRRIAYAGPVVMVGRDVGTVVVPDASLKFYLDASLEERARRRFDERRDVAAELAFDAVLADLQRRDAADSSREVAPLQAASDAIQVGTDGLTIAEVVDILSALVSQTWQTTIPR